eukprot:TRINITY_DN73129_c0_g1_i1.p1 TRINITY_DN73129_c0_g1~~TRINITY_DN73129_c0_g1_i1.p1  ORF type:complete len:2014 (-),score=235.11 TRINITY_DN73129_c0_g1_i1:34-5529(-)
MASLVESRMERYGSELRSQLSSRSNASGDSVSCRLSSRAATPLAELLSSNICGSLMSQSVKEAAGKLEPRTHTQSVATVEFTVETRTAEPTRVEPMLSPLPGRPTPEISTVSSPCSSSLSARRITSERAGAASMNSRALAFEAVAEVAARATAAASLELASIDYSDCCAVSESIPPMHTTASIVTTPNHSTPEVSRVSTPYGQFRTVVLETVSAAAAAAAAAVSDLVTHDPRYIEALCTSLTASETMETLDDTLVAPSATTAIPPSPLHMAERPQVKKIMMPSTPAQSSCHPAMKITESDALSDATSSASKSAREYVREDLLLPEVSELRCLARKLVADAALKATRTLFEPAPRESDSVTCAATQENLKHCVGESSMDHAAIKLLVRDDREDADEKLEHQFKDKCMQAHAETKMCVDMSALNKCAETVFIPFSQEVSVQRKDVSEGSIMPSTLHMDNECTTHKGDSVVDTSHESGVIDLSSNSDGTLDSLAKQVVVEMTSNAVEALSKLQAADAHPVEPAELCSMATSHAHTHEAQRSEAKQQRESEQRLAISEQALTEDAVSPLARQLVADAVLYSTRMVDDSVPSEPPSIDRSDVSNVPESSVHEDSLLTNEAALFPQKRQLLGSEASSARRTPDVVHKSGNPSVATHVIAITDACVSSPSNELARERSPRDVNTALPSAMDLQAVAWQLVTEATVAAAYSVFGPMPGVHSLFDASRTPHTEVVVNEDVLGRSESVAQSLANQMVADAAVKATKTLFGQTASASSQPDRHDELRALALEVAENASVTAARKLRERSMNESKAVDRVSTPQIGDEDLSSCNDSCMLSRRLVADAALKATRVLFEPSSSEPVSIQRSCASHSDVYDEEEHSLFARRSMRPSSRESSQSTCERFIANTIEREIDASSEPHTVNSACTQRTQSHQPSRVLTPDSSKSILVYEAVAAAAAIAAAAITELGRSAPNSIVRSSSSVDTMVVGKPDNSNAQIHSPEFSRASTPCSGVQALARKTISEAAAVAAAKSNVSDVPWTIGRSSVSTHSAVSPSAREYVTRDEIFDLGACAAGREPRGSRPLTAFSNACSSQTSFYNSQQLAAVLTAAAKERALRPQPLPRAALSAGSSASVSLCPSARSGGEVAWKPESWCSEEILEDIWEEHPELSPGNLCWDMVHELERRLGMIPPEIEEELDIGCAPELNPADVEEHIRTLEVMEPPPPPIREECPEPHYVDDQKCVQSECPPPLPSAPPPLAAKPWPEETSPPGGAKSVPAEAPPPLVAKPLLEDLSQSFEAKSLPEAAPPPVAAKPLIEDSSQSLEAKSLPPEAPPPLAAKPSLADSSPALENKSAPSTIATSSNEKTHPPKVQPALEKRVTLVAETKTAPGLPPLVDRSSSELEEGKSAGQRKTSAHAQIRKKISKPPAQQKSDSKCHLPAVQGFSNDQEKLSSEDQQPRQENKVIAKHSGAPRVRSKRKLHKADLVRENMHVAKPREAATESFPLPGYTEKKAQLDAKRVVRMAYNRVLGSPPRYALHEPHQRPATEYDLEAWSHVIERKQELEVKQTLYHKMHFDPKLSGERWRRTKSVYRGPPLDLRTGHSIESADELPPCSTEAKSMAARIMSIADSMARNGRLTVTELQNELGHGEHTLGSRLFGDFFDWMMKPERKQRLHSSVSQSNFERFDANHDGAISVGELRMAVSEYLQEAQGAILPRLGSAGARSCSAGAVADEGAGAAAPQHRSAARAQGGRSLLAAKARSTPALLPAVGGQAAARGKESASLQGALLTQARSPLAQTLNSTRPLGRRPRPGLDFPMPKGRDMLQCLREGISPAALCAPIGCQ